MLRKRYKDAVSLETIFTFAPNVYRAPGFMTCISAPTNMSGLHSGFIRILTLFTFLVILRVAANENSFQRIRRQDSSCECGYKLSSKGGAYFPFKHEVDFTQISNLDGLTAAKMEFNSGGWPIGPVSETDGVSVCKGSKDNYRFSTQNGMQLVVPAQTTSEQGTYTGAEVNFNVPVLHAVSTASIMLSRVPGSSQNFVRHWTRS